MHRAGFSHRFKRNPGPSQRAGLRVLLEGGKPGSSDASVAALHNHKPVAHRDEGGALIEYRIRLYGIPMRWTSEITEWDSPRMFEDTQIRGPYRKWVHRHTFEETDEGTVVTDEVRYRVPGGTVINWLFVGSRVRKIFDYRKAKLKELFSSIPA